MMSTATASSEVACTACRRLKRKCTRQLPQCSLCQRAKRRCEYPADGHAHASRPPPVNERARLAARVAELEHRLSIAPNILPGGTTPDLTPEDTLSPDPSASAYHDDLSNAASRRGTIISWSMAFLDSVTIRGRAKELSALFYKTVPVPEGRDTSTTELEQISSHFYDQVHP